MNHVATRADIAAVRTAIQALRTDMANMQTRLVRWMAVAAIGIALSVGLGIADLVVGVLAS